MSPVPEVFGYRSCWIRIIVEALKPYNVTSRLQRLFSRCLSSVCFLKKFSSLGVHLVDKVTRHLCAMMFHREFRHVEKPIVDQPEEFVRTHSSHHVFGKITLEQ